MPTEKTKMSFRKTKDDLKDVDRRLVRVETVVEFAEKGLVNKRIYSEPKL